PGAGEVMTCWLIWATTPRLVKQISLALVCKGTYCVQIRGSALGSGYSSSFLRYFSIAIFAKKIAL
ncbi:hypothetical protein, partial [Aeromonas sp. HMWF014]|uniref:hypothetical protein n=1 Tax=Aeromonas sp. HMWF014 TaxID=2056850 RepID=UPI001C637432